MYVPDNYDMWFRHEEELEIREREDENIKKMENMDLIDAYTTRNRIQKGERE